MWSVVCPQVQPPWAPDQDPRSTEEQEGSPSFQQQQPQHRSLTGRHDNQQLHRQRRRSFPRLSDPGTAELVRISDLRHWIPPQQHPELSALPRGEPAAAPAHERGERRRGRHKRTEGSAADDGRDACRAALRLLRRLPPQRADEPKLPCHSPMVSRAATFPLKQTFDLQVLLQPFQ